MFLLELLLLFLVLVLSIFAFSLSILFFFGPPYVPTPKKIVHEMLNLVEVNKKDVIVDLGSGDGVVLIEGAKRGATTKGWEINPFLVISTKINTTLNGLNRKVFVYLSSYQNANLKDATVIFCYNLPKNLKGLETKIKKEASKNVKIISYKFPFPTLKLVRKTKSGIHLYRF